MKELWTSQEVVSTEVAKAVGMEQWQRLFLRPSGCAMGSTIRRQSFEAGTYGVNSQVNRAVAMNFML